MPSCCIISLRNCFWLQSWLWRLRNIVTLDPLPWHSHTFLPLLCPLERMCVCLHLFLFLASSNMLGDVFYHVRPPPLQARDQVLEVQGQQSPSFTMVLHLLCRSPLVFFGCVCGSASEDCFAGDHGCCHLQGPALHASASWRTCTHLPYTQKDRLPFVDCHSPSGTHLSTCEKSACQDLQTIKQTPSLGVQDSRSSGPHLSSQTNLPGLI